MTQSASSIILEYVCPCAGMIIANIMFAAPFQDLQTAVRLGDIGSLNCTPWAFMLGNCFGWVLYGILRNNFWVYFANAPGLLMSLWLNLGAVKLLYQKHHSTAIRSSLVLYLQQHQQQQQQQEDDDDQPQQPISASVFDTSPSFPTVTGTFLRSAATTTKDWANIVWQVTSQTTPAPTPHERLVLVIATIWMAVASLVGFAGSTNLIQWNDNDNAVIDTEPDESSTPTIIVSIVGYVVNFNLVFFYGAPLSTIWTVLKQRNTASIHIPTMVTNTLNGSFWLAYGLAVSDAFIYVPNGLGAALGAIQVVLLILFPRQPSGIHSTGTTREEAANVVPTTIITEPTSLDDKPFHDTDNSSDGDQNNTTQRANNDAFQHSPTDDLESPILTPLVDDGTTNIDR
ncbi:sugar efflux transporter [Nitzschia inconspicua]|uniref:Sugar transporter SWEET1 n=1 Tax=Nitzschia inconspicua TaxID=303405 RepID=A0A9K3KXA2_9STRA|nr:sugar efflux transporter [Nitzschia inconspicua]